MERLRDHRPRRHADSLGQRCGHRPLDRPPGATGTHRPRGREPRGRVPQPQTEGAEVISNWPLMDPAAERLLDALLDALPDQVAFTDGDGRFLKVNRAYAERLGLANPAEAVGKSAADLLPQVEAESLRESAAQAVRSGTILPAREICVGVSGEDR